jgi:adenylylsulfate kinase
MRTSRRAVLFCCDYGSAVSLDVASLAVDCTLGRSCDFTLEIMTSNCTGFTLWFTGLSGAGKSSLAEAVADVLVSRGRFVEILDGDEVRRNLSTGLGFSKEDRDTNIRRIGFVAGLLSRNGVVAIAAAISPYRAVREEVSRAHQAPFVEVYVDCPLAELVKRDRKGLYARALRGEIPNFTGVSDPYEPPVAPDIHIRTDRELVTESRDRIVMWLEQRRLVRDNNDHD